jgi:hypothetical protein
VYNDIDFNFKENNKMSHQDSGIDACDQKNTIVQCKLRKDTLTWQECGTFIGSCVIHDDITNKLNVRWNNLIIARNNDCKLSRHMTNRIDMFVDHTYDKNEMLEYCERLLLNPPQLELVNNIFELRDYQNECIGLIKNNNKNIVLNLPTGSLYIRTRIYSLPSI